MATRQIQELSWTVCEGRDGYDTPLQIPQTRAAEMLNMQFNGALGKKRTGSAAVTNANTAGGWFAMTTHCPDQTPSNTWLVAVSTSVGFTAIVIFAGGPAAITIIFLTDAMASLKQLTTFTSHAGKLFIAYSSGVNRLHVVDLSGIRRAGLGLPAAPTVANTGGGAYPATLRYYRVNMKTLSGATVVKQSNLGPNVSFTPSGAGTAARVTKPATIEDATHWQVHGSADDLAYYILSGDIAVGTTTYDDSVLPVNYALGTVSPAEGANTPFPSVKFLASDGTHMFGFGVWETTAGDSLLPVPGRVYFTPAIGTSDTGDSERVSNTLTLKGWIDVSPFNGAGAIDRGISGPINNRMYVFQSFGIYMLIPTGDAVTPFVRYALTTSYGSIWHWAQVIGEDESGQPALYFLDPRDGPRRIALGSTIQWLGRDVSDLWATVNLDSTAPGFGVYDSTAKLVKWWVPTGSSNTPDTMIVFDVTRGRTTEANEVRGGWVKWTGVLAAANCGVTFHKNWSGVSPYATAQVCTYAGLTNLSLVRQDGTLYTDAGSAYTSSIRSFVFIGATLRRQKRLMEAFLFAKTSAATVTQSIIRDMGAQTIASAAISLANVAGETWKRVFFDATNVADITALQIELSDGGGSIAWELGQWVGGDELESGAR